MIFIACFLFINSLRHGTLPATAKFLPTINDDVSLAAFNLMQFGVEGIFGIETLLLGDTNASDAFSITRSSRRNSVSRIIVDGVISQTLHYHIIMGGSLILMQKIWSVSLKRSSYCSLLSQSMSSRVYPIVLWTLSSELNIAAAASYFKYRAFTHYL